MPSRTARRLFRPLARRLSILLSLVLLAGCVTQPQSQQALSAARVDVQRIQEDPNVLRNAPQEVLRAGESLAHAERFADYWGSDADVLHYAYLSQQYAAIARQHSALSLSQERAATLELVRYRLQLGLGETSLLSVQLQGQWLEAQILSLATETERGLVMTLGDVLFDAGRTELKTSANRTVLKLVQFLQLNPQRIVRIEGYTDSRGEAQKNLELSRARAQSVADVLLELGIAGQRIEIEGLGESHPVADNASRRGRAQNRRIEVVFSDEQGRLSGNR